MKTKISQLTEPALAGVVKSRSVRGAIAEIKNCLCDGATMIDLHMSCLDSPDEQSLRYIMESTKLPVLALNYNFKCDFRDAGFDEEARAELFLRAIKAGAAAIDMQGYTFHLPSKNGFCGEDKYSFTKGNPKEIVTDTLIIAKQCALIDEVHSMGAEVLLSCHPDIAMTSDQIVDLALFLEQRKPDVIKIVTKAYTEDDLMQSINAMMKLKKEVKTPVSYHASGPCGAPTRIINPMLGGHIIFCVDRFDESSTMEQVDLRAARTIVDNMKKIL